MVDSAGEYTPIHANAATIGTEIDGDLGATSAMRAVWSRESRIQRYLDVEKALSLTQGRLGVIPQTAADEIAAHCDAREMDVRTLAAATQHGGCHVLPVVEQLTALCTDGLGRWCHWGATTQDITDTATVLQIRDGLALVGRDLQTVTALLAGVARKCRGALTTARGARRGAAPTTFGDKVAAWLAGLDRHAERLAQLKARVLVGGFGGAVGARASPVAGDLAVRRGLTKALGLAQPTVARHAVRDTIAEVGCFLALVCGSLDAIATDVDVMAMAECRERPEPGGGRWGPSTIPKGRNPISCAHITACGREVRRQAAALLGAMNAEVERADGTWRIEWVALPAIFCYSADALGRATSMLGGLVVHSAAPAARADPTDR